jgi:transposase-like protein
MQTKRSNETEPMRRVQARLGRPLKDFLVQRYITDGCTTTEIAAELGLNAVTVTRWMRRLGIELRFPGQRGRAL